jgi:hypothetical protein
VNQGQYAVAIGSGAITGLGVQPPNTIYLGANPAGSVTFTGQPGLYVQPIRVIDTLTGFLPLYYNSTTGEVAAYNPPPPPPP